MNGKTAWRILSGGMLVALGSWPWPLARAEVPFRLFLEAEDCEGLQRYPYHNEDAKGWYARRADSRGYGAPGRAYYAAIHSDAPNKMMTKTLTRPIPPGKYKAFLRVVGPGLTSPNECVLEVTVGKTPVRFQWRDRGKRAKWLPGREPCTAPVVEFAIDAPASTVRFTAITFGGSSHGALYMPLKDTLWIDTLYITSDLNEKSPPPIDEEYALRAGVDPKAVPPRKPHKADETGPNDPLTPGPVSPVHDEPIRLQSFDGRVNLWPNSSFELGMNDGWTGNDSSHVFTDSDLSTENPCSGQYSLQVAGTMPFGRPFRLDRGGTVTLSLYVRGNGQPVAAGLRRMLGRGDPDYRRTDTARYTVPLKLQGKAESQWTRLSVTGPLEPGWYYLGFESSGFLADAVQLEYGDRVTDYAPRAEVEGALRSGQLANIIYEGDQNTLDLWFHNSAKEARDARLRYRIVDVRERVVAEGVTDPVQVPPGKTVKKAVPILPRLRGMFSVSFTLDGRQGTDGETVYLVMPKPSEKPTRHELGGNLGPGSLFDVAVNSRLGLKWVLTCKSRQFASASEGAHPKPDVWNWYDDAAALPAKYGMYLQPALWPDRLPPFMEDKPDRVYRSIRGGSGVRSTVPRMDLWTEHVTKVVDHYRANIQWWCIDDESDGAWDPSYFAKLVEQTCDAAHKACPEVKIGLSAAPEYFEELFALMPAAKMDFLGGSTFDLTTLEGRYLRHISQRFGKPWFCYGVGGRPPMHTMYHTLFHFMPPYPKAARMAQRVTNLMLVQDLKCAGHYAAILKNNGIHYGLNKPLCDYDGTPLPWGGTFGCLGTLLADAVPIDHVKLGNTDRIAHLFQTGGRYAFATYATGVEDLDVHCRPAEREFPGMTFPCPPGSVEVLDMYWNPRADARWDGNRLRVDLNEEPTFFLDKTLGQDGLRKMIAGATRSPELCPMDMAFVPAAQGKGVDVRITLQNRSGKELRDAFLDLRPPANDERAWSIAGDGLVGTPYAALGTIAPDAEKTIQLATVINGKTPCEDARIRANLYANQDAIQLASDHSLWLLPAVPAKSPTIDGKLGEWESRPAAWLAYEWTCMPMGTLRSQLYEKPEHFGYLSYRLDARAMIWAGYDASNAYIAIRLEDDQPVLSAEQGERIRLVFAGKEQPVTLDLWPLPDGTVKLALVARAEAPIQARCQQVEETILNGSDAKPTRIQPVLIEVAIPWKVLGAAPKPGDVIGFDLFWTDVDREEKGVVDGTLRWAGGARDLGFMKLLED